MQVRNPEYPLPLPSRPQPRLRGEAAEQAELKRAAWNMFWLMVGGKLVIMVAIAIVGFHHLQPGQRNLSVLVLLNWSWILLTGMLVAGPVAYWWRLRRVRRKRAALIRAEWQVD